MVTSEGAFLAAGKLTYKCYVRIHKISKANSKFMMMRNVKNKGLFFN